MTGIPIFATLAPTVLEGVARQLEPVAVASGTVVIQEGEPGDGSFAISDGPLAVTPRGRAAADAVTWQRRSRGGARCGLAAHRHGHCRDAPLSRFAKAPFIAVLTGQATSRTAAHAILATDGDELARVEGGAGVAETYAPATPRWLGPPRNIGQIPARSRGWTGRR